MIRSTLLTSLIFSTLCHADFAGMYIDTSDSVVLDGVSYESHRVYALFTDPTDRTFTVAGLGGTGGGPALEFQADNGQLFLDCGDLGCDFFNCDTQSQPVASLHGAYHSFVCIRSGNVPSDFPPFGVKVERDSPLNPGGVYPEFPNNISFSPDVLCSALPNEIRIQGNSWSTGGIDGGYIPADPLNGKSTGQIILIAQFTLPESSEFTFQGNLFYNYTPEGFPEGTEFPGQTEFFVSSLDFSGLSDCPSLEDYFQALTFGTPTDCNNNNILDLCESPDLNGDGLSELCQDCDEDGIPDSVEIKQGTAIDLNENGIDDECDPDCNQNGVPDFYEIEQGSFDCNLDGILDICEISENPALDLNTNTVIDSCEADCNENGTFDFVDILLEFSQDINKNSVPDECEDCDGDGIPDDLEDKADCDGNGLPDVCEVDEDCDNDGDINACDFDDDGDGIEDLCDADSCGLTGQDCDENGILDSCEEFSDCNNNGIDDRCDIQSGEEDDLNLDGTPDSCQCIADVVPNGEVGFPDLVTLLSAWGTCEPPCPSDIIADGDVGFSDLLYLLSNWGPCSG